jgi:predicted Zn-dependent protease
VETSLPGDEAKKPNAKTYDQEKLLEGTREKVLRERFGAAASAMPLMIITDREMTPPEGWRYVFWQTWTDPQPSAVISTVPLDPDFWEISDPRRVATIKSRTRTVAMSVCGTFLGLKPCNNSRCFLYSAVESVTSLDRMDRLGDEHSSEIEGLNGHGFEPTASDPDVVQEIVRLPPSRSRALK